MNKKVKGILGILAGLGLAGAGAFALTRKGVSDDVTDIEDDECHAEETEAEDVEESEE